MAKADKLITADDPHRRRHQAMLMGLIWLSVYPLVTVVSYLLTPVDLPLWLETFLSTLLTVPGITFIVVPRAKRIIAKADPKA